MDRFPSRRCALLAAALVLAAAPPALAQLPQLVISIAENATVGGVPAANEDLLLCDLQATGLGTTACSWSLFFDGSAAGLDTRVVGVDVVPNGSLVIRVSDDSSLPDISAIKRTDLALFIPVDPLGFPYTLGEWRLYLDGDAVKGSSDSRVWDAVDVIADGACEKTDPMSCDLLLSLRGDATLGGVSFDDEDLVRCHPTGFSVGGSITACQWSLFLDASAINGGGAGSFTGQLFAFDRPASNTLLFRAVSQPSLPTHDAQRDLLRYVGTFGTAPVGTTDFYFDGSVAGLTGRTIQALATYPDADDDGIPDGLDNCPGVSNPGQEDADGDGVGDACDADPDCDDPGQADADGDGVHDACDICDACVDPTNTDSDGDGQCNACDYCPQRPDPSCRCGDGIIDAPSEECDLGDGTNGAPGSPCTLSCEIAGHCTGSGTPCDDASDCPLGEGCCGNAIREGDEECDDGNVIADDSCTGECVLTVQGVPVIGCEDVPSNRLLPAFVQRASFRASPSAGGAGFDRWRTKGDFNLGAGLFVDPDSQEVRVIFNQAGPAPLYQATLAPGSYVQGGRPSKPRWTFFDREADAAGALGLRRSQIRLSFNKVSDSFDGRGVPIPIDPDALGAPPIRLRQTVRIDDVCATAVITCTATPNGAALRCSSNPPPPTTSTTFFGTTTLPTTSTTTTTLPGGACEAIVAGEAIVNTYKLVGEMGPKLCQTNSSANKFGPCTADSDCGGTMEGCQQTPFVTADGITLPFPTGVTTVFTVTQEAAAPGCSHPACIDCGDPDAACPSIPGCVGDPSCIKTTCCDAPDFTVPAFEIPALALCVAVDQVACGTGVVNTSNPQTGDNEVDKRGDTSDPGGDCMYGTGDDMPSPGKPCSTAPGGQGADTKGLIVRTLGNGAADAPGMHYRFLTPMMATAWSGETQGCPSDAVFDGIGVGELVLTQIILQAEPTTAGVSSRFLDINGDMCALAGAGFSGAGPVSVSAPAVSPIPYGGGPSISAAAGVAFAGGGPLFDLGFVVILPNPAPTIEPAQACSCTVTPGCPE